MFKGCLRMDPLIPPADATIGERVTFEGYSNDPSEEIKPKQKILEALFPELLTDADNIAKYKDTPFMTTHGPITSSIPNGHIGWYLFLNLYTKHQQSKTCQH